MAKEIEHKYKVKNQGFKELSRSINHIEQGYLQSDKRCTIRVRISNTEAFLTIKGENVGDTRLEYEYPIPVKDARELMKLCPKPVIVKDRYIVPFEGFTWEVDVFQGKLSGLILAEIELPSSESIYTLPDFVGENVTGDPQYYNSNLIDNL